MVATSNENAARNRARGLPALNLGKAIIEGSHGKLLGHSPLKTMVSFGSRTFNVPQRDCGFGKRDTQGDDEGSRKVANRSDPARSRRRSDGEIDG